jgi:transcriptional regulator with XRE-family HTH domain
MEATQRQVAEYLGPRIRRIRRGLDMSQENLADNAGIHRTQISLIESGERLPRIDTMIKLAGALGFAPCELLDGIAWEVGGSRPGKLVVTGDAGDGRGSAGTGGNDA